MPVGYQAKTTNTETVTLVTDPSYWVKILTELERGALSKAEAKLSKASARPSTAEGVGADISIDPEVEAYRDLMVTYSIVDWNLDDARGTKLPITPDNVALLKGRDFDKIYDRVNSLNEDMNSAEQERFPGQSELGNHDGDGVGA